MLPCGGSIRHYQCQHRQTDGYTEKNGLWLLNKGCQALFLVGLGKTEVLDLCFVNFHSSNELNSPAGPPVPSSKILAKCRLKKSRFMTRKKNCGNLVFGGSYEILLIFVFHNSRQAT